MPMYNEDNTFVSTEMSGNFNIPPTLIPDEIQTYRDNPWTALLREYIPGIESAKGQSVAIAVGNTGAGKSTLINALLLKQHNLSFHQIKKRGGKLAVGLPENIDEISPGLKATLAPMQETGSQSTTKKPTIYGGYLCDCAGFADTDGEDAQLMALMSIRLLSKIAKIKDVIIVADFYSLVAVQGKCFKELAEILGRLFSNLRSADITQSLLMVITKNPELLQEEVEENIDDLIAARASALHKSSAWIKMQRMSSSLPKNILNRTLDAARRLARNTVHAFAPMDGILDDDENNEPQVQQILDLTKEEEETIKNAQDELLALGLMKKLASPDSRRTIIADLTKGNSLDHIQEILAEPRELPPNQFADVCNDKEGRQFCNALFKLISQLGDGIKTSRRHYQTILVEENKQRAYEERIKSIQQFLSDKNPRLLLEREIAALETEKETVATKLARSYQSIRDLTTERDSLDTNIPTPYCRVTCDEERMTLKDFATIEIVAAAGLVSLTIPVVGLFTCGAADIYCWYKNFKSWFGRTDKVLKYDEKIPYTLALRGAIYGEDIHGRWTELNEHPNTTTYSVEYISKRGRDANAKIDFYVEKRNMPGNPERIRQINEQLKSLDNDVAIAEKRSMEIEDLLKELYAKRKAFLHGLPPNEEEKLSKELAEKENALPLIQSEILRLKTIMCEKYLRPLYQDQDLYRMIKELITLIDLERELGSENNLIRDFMQDDLFLHERFQEYGLEDPPVEDAYPVTEYLPISTNPTTLFARNADAGLGALFSSSEIAYPQP